MIDVISLRAVLRVVVLHYGYYYEYYDCGTSIARRQKRRPPRESAKLIDSMPAIVGLGVVNLLVARGSGGTLPGTVRGLWK